MCSDFLWGSSGNHGRENCWIVWQQSLCIHKFFHILWWLIILIILNLKPTINHTWNLHVIYKAAFNLRIFSKILTNHFESVKFHAKFDAAILFTFNSHCNDYRTVSIQCYKILHYNWTLTLCFLSISISCKHFFIENHTIIAKSRIFDTSWQLNYLVKKI